MTAEDNGEIVFSILNQNAPTGAWINLKDWLGIEGLTDTASIKDALHYCEHRDWIEASPSHKDIRVREEMGPVIPGTRTRQTLIAMTLANTSFTARLTTRGIEEQKARTAAVIQRELIAKQNDSFSEAMNLARIGAEAAKESAAATKDAVAQARTANGVARTSAIVAIVSAVAAIVAAVWPMFNASDTKQDRLIVLPLLYTPHGTDSDPTGSSPKPSADSVPGLAVDTTRKDSATR
ncbi:MAG: hypothetical protein KA175_00590 [Flavobacteriales bacterium]|nr:hypothetical protein [Flavobacteriales bacterium]MBP6696080.1 hypothetical protein [Flavobacteriales bacterium]